MSKPKADKTYTRTIADVRALGDRLVSRGYSKSPAAKPGLKDELLDAGRLLWHFAREGAPADVIELPLSEGDAS